MCPREPMPYSFYMAAHTRLEEAIKRDERKVQALEDLVAILKETTNNGNNQTKDIL